MQTIRKFLRPSKARSASASKAVSEAIKRDQSARVAGPVESGLRAAAQILGSAKSERKAAASRENGRKGGRPKHKMLNGLCVPTSTPDDYQKKSAAKWLKNHKEIVKAGQSLREAELQQIEAANELESDEFSTARQKAESIYSNYRK